MIRKWKNCSIRKVAGTVSLLIEMEYKIHYDKHMASNEFAFGVLLKIVEQNAF